MNKTDNSNNLDKVAAFIEAMQKDNITIDDLKSYKENKKKNEEEKALRELYSSYINYLKVCGCRDAEKSLDYLTFKKIIANFSIKKINFSNLFDSLCNF